MHRLALGLAISGTAACSGGDMHGDDDTSYNCAAEMRDDEFVAGIEKAGQGGKLNFRLVSANPAPPARGDNEWILQLNTVAAGVVGAPVTGATVAVDPFMPDHNHVNAVPVEIQPMPDAGQYKLAPIFMWMPGLWEVTIDATSGAETDRAIFRFCVPT